MWGETFRNSWKKFGKKFGEELENKIGNKFGNSWKKVEIVGQNLDKNGKSYYSFCLPCIKFLFQNASGEALPISGEAIEALPRSGEAFALPATPWLRA